MDELGAHVSTSGGVFTAPERASAIGSAHLQLFTKQPQRWADPKVTDETAKKFKAEVEKHGIKTTTSHASYLINLATPKADLYEKSVKALEAEYNRCVKLGMDFLVFHPGSATDKKMAEGIERVARALEDIILRCEGDTKILIELTSGGGTKLGSRFEEVGQIRDLLSPPVRRRVKVCLDTCHIWTAGYDFVNEYADVMKKFDETIGLDNLVLFHFNDSQGPLGQNKDRHEDIGKGTIGLKGFENIMQDVRFEEIPKLLETPKGEDPEESDKSNLATLRAMRSS